VKAPPSLGNRVLSNPALLLGGIGLGLMLLAAFAGPQIAPFDASAWRLVEFTPPNTFEVPPIAPGPRHLLGTDPLGRDLLSRLLVGARLTLTTLGLALIGRLVIAAVLGTVAAGGVAVARFTAASVIQGMAGLPSLLLCLVLILSLRGSGGLGFTLALACVGWPQLALFVREEIVRIRREDFVVAATAAGLGPRRLFVSHVARSLAPQFIGLAALEAASILLLLAELGFIGVFVSGGVVFVDDQGRPVLPIRDRAPEWGQMLAGAQYYAFSRQWVAFVPALFVATLVASFNLFGEGIRIAADPRVISRPGCFRVSRAPRSPASSSSARSGWRAR
jgi:peptide/nickel transport system permease protein